MYALRKSIAAVIASGLLLTGMSGAAWAAKLTVTLTNGNAVKFVGVFHRWDEDGNATKPVDKDAKIHEPDADATAEKQGDEWVFEDLKPGKYDLVMLVGEKMRFEGFTFPPVLEFDPFLRGDAPIADDVRDFIVDDIKKSKHYENIVEPLYIGGEGTGDDAKMARVLVQLIRDLPTTFTKGAGTMRHEVWQYNNNYGGWRKEKRTRVLDREILQVSELRTWTWVWDPKLGGIEIKNKPVKLEYAVPERPDPAKLKGLYPY